MSARTGAGAGLAAAFSLHLVQASPRVAAVAHSLLIIAFAVLLALPSLLVGIAPGYDADYHTAYQYHFSRQFWNGELYPRWLPGHNKGHGSPIFLIQYPLPYVATALLRPLTGFAPTDTREARELGVFCALALAAAGLAARAWFRRRCTPAGATLAAAVYIALPYVLGQAFYLRAGLGELTALVWMPLALALADTLRPRFAAISALAAVFALLLLTHATSAVLFVPLLIGYTVAAGAPQTSPLGRVRAVLLALALSVGLAAAYVLPFLAYRSLFDLKAMERLFPSFELGRWFAYVPSSSLWRRFAIAGMAAVTLAALFVALHVWRARVGRLARVSMVATLALGALVMVPDLGPRLIRAAGVRVSSFETAGDFPVRLLLTSVLTVALGFLAYALAAPTVTRREHCLLIAVGGAFLLMLPWSAPLWQASDALANIQFPFRLGGVLSLGVAGLFAAALDGGLQRRRTAEGRSTLLALGLAALVVVGAGALAWRVPERFRSPDTTRLALAHNVDNMFRSYVAPPQVPALAARLGTAPDSFEVALTPVDERMRGEVIPAEVSRGRCWARVTPLKPRVLRVAARCPEAARIRIGQLYSPLWRVVPVTGSLQRPALASAPDGLLEVGLSAGTHDFDLVFDGRWPEWAGGLVTLASLVVVVGGAALAGLRSGPGGRPEPGGRS
jgi:hypothetical protein